MDDCKLPASALSGIGLTQVVGFTHLIFRQCFSFVKARSR